MTIIIVRSSKELSVINLEQSVIIKRPIEEVWNYMSNIQNATTWDRGVLEIKQVPEGPLGVGTLLKFRRQFMGGERIRELRIAELEQNHRVVMEGHFQGMSARIHYILEPEGEATKLTGAADLEISGWWKLLTPLMVNMANRDDKEDLANVKRIMEAQA